MTTAAADFYENFFEKPEHIIRPHPYTNALCPVWDNYEEKIPPVFFEEVLEIVNGRNKKSRMMLSAYVTICLTFS
jgi:hypothetical protein